MIQQIAVLGDVTNYGGRIITASGNGYCGIDGIALLGDLASCPKCRSTGRIIEGANDFVIATENPLLMMVVLLRVDVLQLVIIELLH